MQQNNNIQQKPNKPDIGGLIGVLLIALGVLGCIIGIFSNSNGWYLGPGIPIGYLMISK